MLSLDILKSNIKQNRSQGINIMEPSILQKNIDKGLFLISTTGGRLLEGTPYYGENDWGPEYFRINRFEKIPVKSVRDAKKIRDYYYSPSMAAKYGYCTIDNKPYTEAVSAGGKPTCNVDDARFVKRSSSNNIKVYEKTQFLDANHR